jgi:flavodoxin
MAEKKILVAYATNSGSTAEAARMVAEELGKVGRRSISGGWKMPTN